MNANKTNNGIVRFRNKIQIQLRDLSSSFAGIVYIWLENGSNNIVNGSVNGEVFFLLMLKRLSKFLFFRS